MTALATQPKRKPLTPEKREQATEAQRRYYASHRDQVLAKLRARRALGIKQVRKPLTPEQRDRAREANRRSRLKHHQTPTPASRARARAYWLAHREAINARRRATRHA